MIDIADFMSKQFLFVMLDKNERISFLNDNIVIKNGDNKIIHQSTCYRLFTLFIIGDTTLTTGIIQKAKKFNFTIMLFTKTFRLYEVIGANKMSNTLLHKLQYDYNSLDLAKHITINKIHNQIVLLNKNRKDRGITIEIIDRMRLCAIRVKEANSIQEIMGQEGLASKMYFKRHFDNVDWERRVPRAKPDYINSILDIGYTVLFSFIESILNIYGFDLYRGVLHTQFYLRKSLVCDIVEPFRPIIDMQVKKSINLRQFSINDFIVENNRYVLKWENSSNYVSIFLRTLLDNKESIFRYIQGYYRAFMREKDVSCFPTFELN